MSKTSQSESQVNLQQMYWALEALEAVKKPAEDTGVREPQERVPLVLAAANKHIAHDFDGQLIVRPDLGLFYRGFQLTHADGGASHPYQVWAVAQPSGVDDELKVRVWDIETRLTFSPPDSSLLSSRSIAGYVGTILDGEFTGRSFQECGTESGQAVIHSLLVGALEEAAIDYALMIGVRPESIMPHARDDIPALSKRAFSRRLQERREALQPYLG